MKRNKSFSKRGGVLLIGLLALVIVFFLASEVEDRETHFISLEQISQIKQYDILLAEDILKAQSGLILNYDSIVESAQKITEILSAFEYSGIQALEDYWFAVTMHPGFQELTAREIEIQKNLDLYKELFNKRQAKIERFKALNATLRNSKKSLPLLMDELVNALEKRPGSHLAVDQVQRLLYDESLFLIKSEDELRKRVEQDIEKVRLIQEQYPDLKSQINGVVRHAEIIASQHDEVGLLVAEITDQIHLKQLNDLHDSYNAYFGVLHEIGYSYRVLMFGLALLLLGTILFVWYRLYSANNLVNERAANIELLQNVALAANQAKDLESAIRETLSLVCRYTDWPVGHAYYYVPDDNILVPSGVWYLASHDRFQAFKDITDRTSFACGEGLPGRVLETGKSAWIPDVQTDTNFPRNKQAGNIGVHAGFCFPVLVADDVVAVLEFFAAEIVEPDNELLERISVIGTQLGRVMERRKAMEEMTTLVEQRTEELQKSEERFALAVRGSANGIWDWNILTDEFYYSPRFQELLGYNDQTFTNAFDEWESRLHEEDKGQVLVALEAHLKNRDPFDVTHRLKTKSGDYRWYQAKGQAIWDEKGEAIRMAGSLSDVTDRKSNEETFIQYSEEILNSRTRLEAVLNNVLDGIITIDAKGIIQSVNPAVEEMFHYESHEVLGENIKMLMPDNYAREHDQYLKNYHETGEEKIMGKDREVEAMRRDGTMFPVELGISEVTISGERMFVGIIRDISARKQTEQELVEAKNKAEEATQLKSEFLANMSHEIRTPMNGIIGTASLMMDTSLDQKQRDHLKTIRNSSESLLQLINDILDFSKIEAKKMTFEVLPFDLQVLAEEVKSVMFVNIKKGVEFNVVWDEDAPRYVMGDPGRIRQVLFNLVSNAIKFTDKGAITLSVQSEGDEKDKHKFLVSVEDTGIGIPEDKLDYIFGKFGQAEESTTRRFGGTGLGLAISTELVKMMDGDIQVESAVGKGSKFSFTMLLPLATEEDAEDVNDSRELDFDKLEFDKVQVLLAEDNMTNMMIATEMLEQFGCHVTPAGNGLEAVERMSKQGFDLVFMDCRMPEMDGYQATGKIREYEANESLSATPIVALTANAMKGDRDACLEAGMDDYVSKPIKKEDLAAALVKWVSEEKIREKAA